MPLLELSGVDISYGGVRAVRDLSLHVGDGEIVALLGANGAGKSTTLAAISGLVRPSAGRISLGGTDLAALSPAAIVRLGAGHVPEGRRVFGGLTVRENLQLGGYVLADEREVNRRVAAVCELLPVLAERRAQNAATLSGGEQQLLAIGRALIARPRLLMLDEPTMGLAPRMARTVLGLVKEINQQGTSVLLVEQNARAALGLAQRGYVLSRGRLGLHGDAAGLRADRRVIEAYLG
ncbi:ABC transporter ATP-binding protein [Longispora albida]|uniref:ABC transporter ATP-binding protein n=1 Tax=Longispora albida TaxID=203523 RepID=UPI00038074D4|nr:ABC transporter ATP-binding protein [Longispora albida]